MSLLSPAPAPSQLLTIGQSTSSACNFQIYKHRFLICSPGHGQEGHEDLLKHGDIGNTVSPAGLEVPPPLGPKWDRWASDPPVCSLLVWEHWICARVFFAHQPHLGPSGGDFKASWRNCMQHSHITLVTAKCFQVDNCAEAWLCP